MPTNQVEEKKSEPENEIDLSVTTTVKMDSLYEIELPTFLMETDKLNPDARLQYFSLQKKFFLIIIDENAIEIKDAMSILNVELEENKIDTQIVDYYIQFQINTLKNAAENYDYPNVKRIELNGNDARQFEISADNPSDNTRYHFKGTAIQGEFNVFYMYIYYPEEFYPEYAEMTNRIVDSFRTREIPAEDDGTSVEKKNGPKQKQNI
jgi:hypothetical protein